GRGRPLRAALRHRAALAHGAGEKALREPARGFAVRPAGALQDLKHSAACGVRHGACCAASAMALTREQTDELGSAIEERRRALVNELREDVARSRGTSPRELSGTAPDPGDESVADLIGDLDRAE